MSNDIGKSDMALTESKTTGTVGNFSHGSRETPVTCASSMGADRSEKARCYNSDMHVTGESHSSIVPEKPANKGRVVPRPAESVEGRGLTKENTEQSLLDQTQSREMDGRPFITRSRGSAHPQKDSRKWLRRGTRAKIQNSILTNRQAGTLTKTEVVQNVQIALLHSNRWNPGSFVQKLRSKKFLEHFRDGPLCS